MSCGAPSAACRGRRRAPLRCRARAAASARSDCARTASAGNDRMHFECLERVFVIRRDEHDGRHLFRAQLLTTPVLSRRHLHVETRDRMLLLDRRHASVLSEYPQPSRYLFPAGRPTMRRAPRPSSTTIARILAATPSTASSSPISLASPPSEWRCRRAVRPRRAAEFKPVQRP